VSSIAAEGTGQRQRLYPLTDDEFREIVREVAERRAAGRT
jgi:hypothetical protein